MKKLLIVLPLLFACKTSKHINCDAYGSKQVEKNELVLKKQNIKTNYCEKI